MTPADRVGCGTGVSLRPEKSHARDSWQADPQCSREVVQLGHACTPSVGLGQEHACVLWTGCEAVSERAGALGLVLNGCLHGQTGLLGGKAGGGLWMLRVRGRNK